MTKSKGKQENVSVGGGKVKATDESWAWVIGAPWDLLLWKNLWWCGTHSTKPVLSCLRNVITLYPQISFHLVEKLVFLCSGFGKYCPFFTEHQGVILLLVLWEFYLSYFDHSHSPSSIFFPEAPSFLLNPVCLFVCFPHWGQFVLPTCFWMHDLA